VKQIFSRDAFSDIGRAFRDRTYPTAEMMMLGYASLISELGPSRAVLFDWSCLRKHGVGSAMGGGSPRCPTATCC
jgi:hypothetical protein